MPRFLDITTKLAFVMAGWLLHAMFLHRELILDTIASSLTSLAEVMPTWPEIIIYIIICLCIFIICLGSVVLTFAACFKPECLVFEAPFVKTSSSAAMPRLLPFPNLWHIPSKSMSMFKAGLKPFTTVFRRLLTMLSSTPKVDIPDFRQYLQDADREISALLLLFAEQNVFINGLKAAADQSCASIEDLKKVVTEKDASIVGLQNTTNGQVTRIGELCLEVSRLDSRRKRAVNERIAAENTLRITNDKCQSRIASNDAKVSANNSRMLKMAKRQTVLDRERDQEAKKLEEAAEQAERAYDTACNELKAKIKRAEKAEKTAENDAAKVRKRLQGIKSEHQKDTAALQGENNVLESRLSNIQHGHDQMFKGWNQASRQDRGKIARLESEKEAKEEEVERADQVIKNLNLEVARRASEKVEGEKVAGQKLRVLKKTTDKLRAEMLEKTETADSKTKDLEQQIKKRDGEIKLLKFDVGRYRDTFHDRLVSSMSCVSGQIEATQEETRVAQREAGAQKFVKVRAWERIEELQGLLEMQTQPESDNPDAQRPTSNVQIYEQELRKANDREEELQRTVKEEKAEVLKLRNELQKSTSSNKEELERCQRREANQPVGTKKDDQKLRLKIGRVVQLEKRKHRASGRKERRRLSRKLKSSAAVQVKNLESMLQNLSTGTQIQVTGCQQQIEATRSRAETAESSNTALTDELARVRKAKDDAETRAEQLSQQVKDAAGQVETLQKDAGDTETRYEAILNDMKEKMAGVERDTNRANDLFSELSGWPTDDAEYGCLAELYHGHAAVRDLKAKLQDDESDLSKHWNTEATIGSITSQLDGASVQRGTTRKVDADLAPAMLFQCRALNAKAESLKRLLEQGPLMSKEEFLAELDGARGDEGVLGRDFVRTQEEEQDSEGDAEMEGESDAQTQPAAAYPPSPFSTPSTSQPLQTRPPTSQASSSQAPLGYLPAYLQNASPSHTLVEGSSTPNPFLAFRPGAPRPTFSQHQSQSQPFSGSRLPLRSPPYTPPSVPSAVREFLARTASDPSSTPQRQPPPPGHLGAKRNARDALGPVPESASKRREAEDNAVERGQNDAAGPSTPGPSQQGGTALREFGRLRNFRLAPSGLRNVTRPGDDDEGESSEEE